MHFVRQSQYPFHGSGDYTDYPGEWDDKQAMAATVVRFTPSAGDFAGLDRLFLYYRGADDLLSGAGVVSIGMMTANPLTFNGRNWDKQRAQNPVIQPGQTPFLAIPAGVTDPIVVVQSGQSNARGVNGGGEFPSSALVSAWLATTSGGAGGWVVNPDFSATTYYIPGTTVSVGGGNNNAGLAMCHRIAAETGRQVRFVIEALGGQSIDQWVASGTSSARYVALKARVAEALASLGKTRIDVFLWQQGEADHALTAAAYEAKLTTLFTQLRAESWWVRSGTPATTDTIAILGEPIYGVATLDSIREALALYASGEDFRTRVASASGLPQAGDNLHFTGQSYHRLGYYRYINAYSAALGSTSPVLGGDYNDMSAVADTANGVIRLFVNIYGNPSGTNRLVQFTTTNGYDFENVGEATLGGSYFGSTVGGMFYIGTRLWALCGVSASNGGGSNRRLRYSDDNGMTWTNAATAITVAADQNAWNGFSLIVGRAFISGNYVYAVQPGMRYLGLDGAGDAYADWPEAIGLWRKALANINDGLPWEAYARNPIMVRGPTEGGCWQLSPLLLNSTAIGPYQTWAHPDWDNIGSANMVELRDTPYAGLGEGWSTKHQYTAQAINQLALQNWSLNPLPNGTYAIRHAATGRWLGVNGSGGAVLTQSDAPATLFHLSRRNDFTLIRRDTSSGDALRVADLSRNTWATFAAPGDTSDRTVEWHIEIIAPASLEVGETVTAFITSRHSSLSLAPRIEAVDSAVPVVQGPALYGSAEHVFEIIPVR